MRYDKEKHFFMTKKFIGLGNVTLVQRAWKTKFKNTKPPSRSTILGVGSKLEKTGSLNDIPPFHTKPKEKREEAKSA